MIETNQYWKEKLGNYETVNREYLTPEELVKLEYNIGDDTLTFTKKDLLSFNHKQSCDLNSLTLPENEIKFEIDNIDGRWNPDNPQGLYKNIAEKQQVNLYYGLNQPTTFINIMPDKMTNTNLVRCDGFTYDEDTGKYTASSVAMTSATVPTPFALYKVGPLTTSDKLYFNCSITATVANMVSWDNVQIQCGLFYWDESFDPDRYSQDAYSNSMFQNGTSTKTIQAVLTPTTDRSEYFVGIALIQQGYNPSYPQYTASVTDVSAQMTIFDTQGIAPIGANVVIPMGGEVKYMDTSNPQVVDFTASKWTNCYSGYTLDTTSKSFKIANFTSDGTTTNLFTFNSGTTYDTGNYYVGYTVKIGDYTGDGTIDITGLKTDTTTYFTDSITASEASAGKKTYQSVFCMYRYSPPALKFTATGFTSINDIEIVPVILKMDNPSKFIDIGIGDGYLDESLYYLDTYYKAGTFYMSGWDCPQNGLSAQFTASSSLDFGTDKFGTHSFTSQPTYADVAKQAYSNMGLDTQTIYRWQKWNYKSGYESVWHRLTVEGMGEAVPPGMIAWNAVGYSTSQPEFNSGTGTYHVRVDNNGGGEYVGLTTGRYYFIHNGTLAGQYTDIQAYFEVYSGDASGTYFGNTGDLINDSSDDMTITYRYSSPLYSRGDTRLTDATSVNADEYPSNGFASGYWYISLGPQTPKIVVDSVLSDYTVENTSLYLWPKSNLCYYTETTASAYNYYSDKNTIIKYSPVPPKRCVALDGQDDCYFDFSDWQTSDLLHFNAMPHQYFYIGTETKNTYYMQYKKDITFESARMKWKLEWTSHTSTTTKDTTARAGTQSFGYVSSSNSSAYPSGGAQGGYYYGTRTTGYVPSNMDNITNAGVVQLTANATMCQMRYDVDGILHVELFDDEPPLTDYVIDLFVSYSKPEYNLTKNIKDIMINNNFTINLAETGENQQISNQLITDTTQATLIAGWIGSIINTRKEISGEYRCDPRLQVYDYIKSVNQYAVNECYITDLDISYSGSWQASYTGRVVKSIPLTDLYGNYYAGDKQRTNNVMP